MKLLVPVLGVALCLSACAVAAPEPQPLQTVTLTTAQQTNLRTLLGLLPSSPFTVAVLDHDASRNLNPGDIAVTRGGITNGEISRRVLRPADVDSINATAASPLMEAARQLQAAQAKWQQKRPEHYAYTLQRSCFCAPDYRKPIEIRVLQGKVQQATLLPEGKPLPADRQAEAMPVEGLFGMIQNAIDDQVASLTVTYDTQYGFPASISIDRDKRMADEEIQLSAGSFNVASGLKPAQNQLQR